LLLHFIDKAWVAAEEDARVFEGGEFFFGAVTVVEFGGTWTDLGARVTF
jgi:hypothetical protein